MCVGKSLIDNYFPFSIPLSLHVSHLTFANLPYPLFLGDWQQSLYFYLLQTRFDILLQCADPTIDQT
jgi:hypothetical protein